MNLSRIDIFSGYQRLYAAVMLTVIFGYMFLGKGFAYLHLDIGIPLFIGEILLLGGALLMLMHLPQVLGRYFTEPALLLQLLFVILGMIGTIPFMKAYGIIALRDAAAYYYSVFMAITFLLLHYNSNYITIFIRRYYQLAAIYVYWVPLAFFLFLWHKELLPVITTDSGITPIIGYKAGDMKVHLAGTAVFVFMATLELRRYHLGRIKHRVIWYVLLFIAIFTGINRGSFLALLCALAVLTIFYRRKIYLVKSAMITAAVLLLVYIINPSVTPPGVGQREISPQLVAASLMTVVQDKSEEAGYSETRNWRLEWWKTIFEETFFGKYFWSGRGFGLNLADAHGFQVSGEEGAAKLRSPHNYHLTILARMGVPGLVVWLLLLFVLYRRFIRGVWRARATGDSLKEVLLIWVMAYGAAFLVNSTFDVFLEGPQGAICFWSLMGLGLTVSGKRFKLDPARPAEGGLPVHSAARRGLPVGRR